MPWDSNTNRPRPIGYRGRQTDRQTDRHVIYTRSARVPTGTKMMGCGRLAFALGLKHKQTTTNQIQRQTDRQTDRDVIYTRSARVPTGTKTMGCSKLDFALRLKHKQTTRDQSDTEADRQTDRQRCYIYPISARAHRHKDDGVRQVSLFTGTQVHHQAGKGGPGLSV